MTIDEAIKDLIPFTEYCERVNWLTHKKAVQLGIEALKAIKADRCFDGFPLNHPLPGETEEEK